MDKKVLLELHRFFEEERHVLVAYLFGSVVKETAGRLSDVDVGVVISRDYGLTLDYHLHLIVKLARIIRRETDVVILNEASPLLRYEVIRCGKVLYCRDEGERVAFEERTLDEYLDMNRIEREYLRCLLQSVE